MEFVQKLINRHPHVFNNVDLGYESIWENLGRIKKRWKRVKLV